VNTNFYGRCVSSYDLLSGAVPPPPAAQYLYDAIQDVLRGEDISVMRYNGGYRGPSCINNLAKNDADEDELLTDTIIF
jgi:hypothetical protein